MPVIGMKVTVKVNHVMAPTHAYSEETLVLVSTRSVDEGGLGHALGTFTDCHLKTPISAFQGSNRQPMLQEPLPLR
jgi:hypothetical protein